MKKIAVYGKGGIGKSTVTSNLSAAMAYLGHKVMQIGCDPKADSTINLLGGVPPFPVMDALRDETAEPTIETIVKTGYKGISCIETGGPAPGIGCAGRGIIATFHLLEELQVFETLQPEVVLYDVLGDVVCGGFAAPIREGYAEDVYIVTSGEKMSLFAAKNIAEAVANFADRGYARVRGVILNRRDVRDEEARVRSFAESIGVPIVSVIPRSQEIQAFEDAGKTVIEGDTSLPISKVFLTLAERILHDDC
ncbi:MAG: nitrogenase iron protein NifH [Oscillospiraceae bacterium]|jgi:nitrogenase iron protein NifH|nr:nitrogenase iron protein NifH [Oscillospiraceae bacterium]